MGLNDRLTGRIKHGKFVVILGLLVLRTAQSLPEIASNCGQLTIEGYNFCEIEHDNEVSNFTGPAKKVLTGPFFGLITYKCDQTAGYLLSQVDCEKCNFECSEEDQTASSCRTDSNQFWMGVIFGGVLSVLIGGFVYKRFPQTLDASSWFNRSGNAPEKGSIATTYMEDQVIFNREEAESDTKGDTQGSVGFAKNE